MLDDEVYTVVYEVVSMIYARKATQLKAVSYVPLVDE